MRELKFRVYIPDHGKFCYFTLGNFDYSDRYLHQHSYPVQQYTGLKDKNGKEIFEGDIVKYSRCHAVSVEERKNVFSSKLIEDGDFVGEIIFIFPSFCWSYDHKRYDDIESMTGATHRYEVIGNIFETPELLK